LINRQEDAVLANLTRQQEQRLVNEQRIEDQRRAIDLHYQNVYSNYIEDISNVIYKQSLNQTIFANEESKMSYIRRKTLLTLREIDSERKSQLFIFLHENHLLPNKNAPNTTISLIDADLHGITIRSPITGPYYFDGLVLKSVNLVNTSFLNCRFINGFLFTGSAMSHINFHGSIFRSIPEYVTLPGLDHGIDFGCSEKDEHTFFFEHVSLDYANFKDSQLCGVVFRNVNLSYANFTTADLAWVEFISQTELMHSNWFDAKLEAVSFINSNLSSATSLDVMDEGIQQFSNVVLPNGTWQFKNDIVINGDAESDCKYFNGTVTGWKKYTGKPVIRILNKTATHYMNGSVNMD
ncbi:unnamed protein product, partial [Rotaria sordida]